MQPSAHVRGRLVCRFPNIEIRRRIIAEIPKIASITIKILFVILSVSFSVCDSPMIARGRTGLKDTKRLKPAVFADGTWYVPWFSDKFPDVLIDCFESVSVIFIIIFELLLICGGEE